MCHLDVEDDIHFMLSCPKLKKKKEQIVKKDFLIHRSSQDLQFVVCCSSLIE